MQDRNHFGRQARWIQVLTVVRLLGEIVVDLNKLIVAMLLSGSEMCDIEIYRCGPIRLVLYAYARGE
ncbi:MAG TPA: hypothetical protein VIY68_13905 [Steroidobacteraceae bacterium]